MNIKQIVISLIDRLAAYAAREAENEDPEETKRQEEAAARRLAEKVKIQKAKLRMNGHANGASSPTTESVAAESNAWGSTPTSPVVDKEKEPDAASSTAHGTEETAVEPEKLDKGKEKATEPQVRKFRGVPEDVKLFEVFWQQVVELIKVRSLVYHQLDGTHGVHAGSARPVNTGHDRSACVAYKSIAQLLS